MSKLIEYVRGENGRAVPFWGTLDAQGQLCVGEIDGDPDNEHPPLGTARATFAGVEIHFTRKVLVS